jgi:hypothetical protein
MLKRVLVAAAVLFMFATLIDDPLTTLGMLIWFGDEGQAHPKRRAHFSGS